VAEFSPDVALVLPGLSVSGFCVSCFPRVKEAGLHNKMVRGFFFFMFNWRQLLAPSGLRYSFSCARYGLLKVCAILPCMWMTLFGTVHKFLFLMAIMSLSSVSGGIAMDIVKPSLLD